MHSILLFTLTLMAASAEPSGTTFPEDIRRARDLCRQETKWPEQPPTIPGCAVNWDDPQSVETHVKRPKSRRSPRPARPLIPQGEEVRASMLILEYLISSEGKVVDVCVLRSVSPTIDSYFVRLARATEFTPGTICDQASDFSMLITVNHHGWEWPRAPESGGETQQTSRPLHSKAAHRRLTLALPAQ